MELVAKMVMRNVSIVILASPVTLDAWEPTYDCDYTQSNDWRGKMSKHPEVLMIQKFWVLVLLAPNDKSQTTLIFLFKVASQPMMSPSSEAPLFCDFLTVDGKNKKKTNIER